MTQAEKEILENAGFIKSDEELTSVGSSVLMNIFLQNLPQDEMDQYIAIAEQQ